MKREHDSLIAQNCPYFLWQSHCNLRKEYKQPNYCCFSWERASNDPRSSFQNCNMYLGQNSPKWWSLQITMLWHLSALETEVCVLLRQQNGPSHSIMFWLPYWLMSGPNPFLRRLNVCVLVFWTCRCRQLKLLFSVHLKMNFNSFIHC